MNNNDTTNLSGMERGLQSASPCEPESGVEFYAIHPCGRRSGLKPALHCSFARAVVTFTLLLSPFAAKADGGVVRTRATQGTLVVTIFTPLEVSRGLPVDVTVMVQNRETGEVVMDAAVNLSFVPPPGTTLSPNDVLCASTNNMTWPGTTGTPPPPAAIRATRGQAANKLFYGTTVVLRAVGDWQLRASIRQGSDAANVTCTLPVGVAPRRLTGLWPYLTLPPFVIALFGLNQWLRRRPFH